MEIFYAAKLQFSTQCAHPTRCNRSAPPISTLAWDIFPQPLATLRAPQLTNARPTKKNGALSRQMCPLSEKTPQLFSPLAPLPFFPSAIARARKLARAHALSEFSIFAFTARRIAHNPLKTSGLHVKPSPYFMHDISNITHCETIICGEGSGEGKNAKKGEGKQGEAFTRISLFDNNLRPNGEEVKAKNRKMADARAYARVVSFFTAVGRYPIGTRNTGSTKQAQSLIATLP